MTASPVSSPVTSSHTASLLPPLPKQKHDSPVASSTHNSVGVLGFMTDFARKHGKLPSTMYWDVKILQVKEGVDIAILDFLKSRNSTNETHWAHKAEAHDICFDALLKKASSKKKNEPSDLPSELPDLSDQLFDILNSLSFCKLRNVPDGPNVPKKVQGTQVAIDKHIWYMFITSGDNAKSINTILGHIQELFNNAVYQQMYHSILQNMIKNKYLLADADVGNTYWKDLSLSLDTVTISSFSHL